MRSGGSAGRGRPRVQRTTQGSSPSTSTTSAWASDVAMSEPCPPAFIRTAPPIDPGTPTAHSNPVSPTAAVRRATTGSAAPPPAVTIEPSMSMSEANSVMLTAIPAKPSSATSRLDPRPTTSTGRPEARRAAATARRSSTVRARTNRAAGPPTLYVVIGASGSSLVASDPRTRAAMSALASPVLTPPSGGSGGRGSPRGAWRCPRSPSRCTRRPAPPHRPGTTPGPRAAAARRPERADGRRARR